MTGSVDTANLGTMNGLNTLGMSYELFLACGYGNLFRLLWLITKYSPDVMQSNTVRLECLAAALSGGHILVAKYLKVYYFPSNINERFRSRNSFDFNTLLEYAVQPHLAYRHELQCDLRGLKRSSHKDALEAVKLLIQYKAKVNLSTHLIHRCIESGRNNVIWYVCNLPETDLNLQTIDESALFNTFKTVASSLSMVAELYGNEWAKKFLGSKGF